MLNIKEIRENPELVQKKLDIRGKGYTIDKILELDKKRRRLLTETESKKAKRNSESKKIPLLKKQGENVTEFLKELKKLSDEITSDEEMVTIYDSKLSEMLYEIPNTPNENTPKGNSDEDNVEVKVVGTPTKFDFEPKPHWELGEDLDILDFERAVKVTGSRFAINKGMGARLERALINFMLDLHTTEHKFKEVMVPYMINRASMLGTGQLPKFEDDMFHIPAKDYFLTPTAEVPVTNIYRDEILKEEDLPIYHTAFTPCFRKEAGSAGRDTRGLIRVHQFNKVELVKFVHPEKSYDELETLLLAAEEVLKRLKLPYRVINLCGGDLGFSSAKTYDIEVFMPSYDRYVEISSCSNFEDFQARRAGIRYREEETSKVRFLHTLNGSGLAVGRCVAAILENYQNEDGSVTVPQVLIPYMNGVEVIK